MFLWGFRPLGVPDVWVVVVRSASMKGGGALQSAVHLGSSVFWVVGRWSCAGAGICGMGQHE